MSDQLNQWLSAVKERLEYEIFKMIFTAIMFYCPLPADQSAEVYFYHPRKRNRSIKDASSKWPQMHAPCSVVYITKADGGRNDIQNNVIAVPPGVTNLYVKVGSKIVNKILGDIK